MPRKAKGLTAGYIEKGNKNGRFGDGAGLYLTVRAADKKWFVFRYKFGGRLREAGLGSAVGPGRVSLAEARATRDRLQAQVRAGIDPLAAKAAAKAAQAKAVTFREVADQYIAVHRAGWRSEKHASQWPSSLAAYAHPLIGSMSVADIDVAALLKVLTPIWTAKPSTASRVRTRIECILDYAKAKGLREGENPGRWRGNLDHLLPAAGKVASVKHFAALDYRQLPAFMAELAALPGTDARLTAFTILTACRSSESLGCRWAEIDIDNRIWTLPPERTKSGRGHRVPLSDACLDILRALPRINDHVFPGGSATGRMASVAILDVVGKKLKRRDITPHGFRSTFRDWAGDIAHAPREVAEACLAHSSGDSTERAYARSDLLERRRSLMSAWAAFALGEPVGNVLQLSAARAG
jgi:integrase